MGVIKLLLVLMCLLSSLSVFAIDCSKTFDNDPPTPSKPTMSDHEIQYLIHTKLAEVRTVLNWSQNLHLHNSTTTPSQEAIDIVLNDYLQFVSMDLLGRKVSQLINGTPEKLDIGGTMKAIAFLNKMTDFAIKARREARQRILRSGIDYPGVARELSDPLIDAIYVVAINAVAVDS